MKLLSSLNDNELKNLIKYAAIESVQPSTPVYTEGEPLDNTFCLLLEGVLQVQIGGSRVGTMCPGSTFGESAYFPGGTRTATVSTTSEPAVILKFTLSAEELETSFPSLYRKLLESAVVTAERDAQRLVDKRNPS